MKKFLGSIETLAEIIDASIRVLYNSSREDFHQIFGPENAGYLWDVFTGRFTGDQEGAFICYLDGDNKKKVAQAALDYLANGGSYPSKPKGKTNAEN